jgi:hypothetical protein
LCKPIGDWYLIKEEFGQMIGFGKFTFKGRNLGFDVIRVQRSVVTICAEQDLYYDNKKLCGAPSLRQALMDYLGIGTIMTRPTGVHRFLLAYSGYRNYLEVFKYQVEASVFDPLRQGIYGVDPIPDIALYNNSLIRFESVGGRGDWKAFAVYDASKRRLEQISERDAQKLTPHLPPAVRSAPGSCD